jgi:hypothetical protein
MTPFPTFPSLRAAALAAALAWGCGYHAVYGGETERFRVVLVRSLIPDAIASDEVVSGVREALARDGALAGGEGYPRIEVEVLRADEGSEGIAAPSAALGGSVSGTGPGSSSAQGPRARGTEVGLVARACLVRANGGTCERDTGDMRAMDLAASDLTAGAPDVASDAFHHRDVLRGVGKRLGDRLARHILGDPTASDEAIGRER